MKKNSSLIIIFIVVIITILIFVYIKQPPEFYNNSDNVILDSKKFKNIKLAQPPEFYKKNYDATLKYLTAVYPYSQKLKLLTFIELAQFYNSLWMYYNCESSYKKTIPYIPPIDIPSSNPPSSNRLSSISALRGEKNIDTDKKTTTLCWQELPGCGDKYPKLPYTPQGYIYSFTSWIENDWQPFVYSDSVNFKPFQITSSVPGQTFWNWYTGPAPVWMYQRTIFRMVFNTNSPTINSHGFRIPAILPGNINSINPSYKYPNNWWIGAKDYDYVEVTAASEPGLAESPPICWYDGWYGSGQFLNVGRSLRVRNKVDGVWNLVNEMKTKSMGSMYLKKWYGSDDPYQVCWNLVNINDNDIYCKEVSGPIIWNKNTNSKIQCNFCLPFGSNNGSLPNTSKGWYDIHNFDITNSKQWCGNDNDMYKCVDKMRYGLEYMPDRQASIMTFDEPLFSLGQYLNYDTIQMTNSANGSGFWQYEILELRGYPDNVKIRDLSDFITLSENKTCPASFGDLEYKSEFIKPYMEYISKFITLRDPLDVYNNNSCQQCINLPWNETLIPMPYKARKNNSWEYNITCQGNLSNMFNNSSIFGGPDNQCSPDGIGFSGKPMINKLSQPYG